MSGFDPYPVFPTLTLGQLAEYFGVTSHVIGRWLKDIDFRSTNGRPSQQAIEAGVAQPVRPSNGGKPFWAWTKEKSLQLLEASGYKRLGPPKIQEAVEQNLIGPFTAERSDPEGGGFEIKDATGITAIWCQGEVLAGRLVKLLNICHCTGKWFVEAQPVG